jgi:zinc transport system permease protein
MEYWNLIFAPEGDMLRLALIAGLLSSLCFGMMGSFVVVRRLGALAGAIAHSTLGGIGLSFWLKGNYDITWLSPMGGAVLFAVSSALLIGIIKLYSRERADTLINAVWVMGMSAGILFLADTPGYVDASSYLFGSILLVQPSDIYLILILDILVVALFLLLYNRFLAMSFDQEFASLRGIPVKLYYVLFLVLTALSIVVMMRIVGVVMVIALLTLPAATAGRIAGSMLQMIWISIVLVAVAVVAGMNLSYVLELPAGAVIVMLAGAMYILSLLGGKLLRILHR